MPIKYTSYGCQFKCGWKHTENWSNVVVHESQCWHNPEVKSCVTCKYGEMLTESNDYSFRDTNRYCNKRQEELPDRKPKTHCNDWESL